MPPLTPARLAELRRLADEATPGPWNEDGPFWVDPPGQPMSEATVEARSGVTGAGRVLIYPGTWETRDADAAFIAAAREAVPELLDALARAESAARHTEERRLAEQREAETNEAALARVEALADEWAGVLTECKETDPRWLLDRSVTTLDTALTELRAAVRGEGR